MALKSKLKSKEEIPAGMEEHYVEREGAWVLEAEGYVEKAKMDEFRNSNVALRQKIEENDRKFAGIDPEEYRKLVEEKRQLEEAQQIKAGETEKVFENRMKNAKVEWEKQLTTMATNLDKAQGMLASVQIDQAVVAEATKRGLRPTAIEDATARARKLFALVDGVPRAYEADGRTARVGKDGLTPLGIAEWVEALVSDAPHLFERSVGGGAAGDGSGGVGNRSVSNPWRKDTWHMTEQMKLEKSDPQLAIRLKAAARGNQ